MDDTTKILTTATIDWTQNAKFLKWQSDNLPMVLYNTRKRTGILVNETFTLETADTHYTATIFNHTITLNYADGTVKTYTDPTPDQPLPDSDDFSQFL